MKGLLGNDESIVVCSEDGAEGAEALRLTMLHLLAILTRHKVTVKAFSSFQILPSIAPLQN